MEVVDWLLDSDPSIRWQVMRDLTDAPDSAVTAERARVASEGWGARLLSLQDEEGQWGRDDVPVEARKPGGDLPSPAIRKLLRELGRISLEDLSGFLDIDVATLAAWEEGEPDPDDERSSRYRRFIDWSRNVGTYNPKWISTTYTLLLLRDMGPDPHDPDVRRAVGLVRDNSKWENDGQDYFDGETEECINGMAVAIGAYFGENVDGIVERLLGERLADGGWNCEAENGSVRSSFHTTISVLEGLLEYEKTSGASPEVTEARLGAEEYLLERRLLRGLTTGEVIDPAWTQFAFPTRWHYDVLRGLEYFRASADMPDSRLAETLDLVESKRQPDGRWLVDTFHPGRVHFDIDGGVGEPSRWISLRALRVLRWAGR